jgi:glycosyltransferase involved in cell wall biosynthesis
MKIALIHDYLREYGGAERVVEAMHEIWPEAPLYTSFVDWNSLGAHTDRFRGWDIRTSWVQDNLFVKRYHSPLRFLARRVWESLDLSGFDVVISSSGWFICRGVQVPKSAVHISYIHHPPRSLYGYATGSTLERYAAVRAYALVVNHFQRKYDFETAQKVNFFIANSHETRRRVQKFYRRDAAVIYPPVDMSVKPDIGNTGSRVGKKQYFLSVGRLSWAKRIDLAIGACNALKLPLKVVGAGREMVRLKKIAGPTVEFLGSVSDAELTGLYGGAKALIFSALDEDFGMVPVEAMTQGCPVIALAQGGVLETVVDGRTGIHFQEPSIPALTAAIDRFERSKNDWAGNSRRQARMFSKERFRRELVAFVAQSVKAH